MFDSFTEHQFGCSITRELRRRRWDQSGGQIVDASVGADKLGFCSESNGKPLQGFEARHAFRCTCYNGQFWPMYGELPVGRAWGGGRQWKMMVWTWWERKREVLGFFTESTWIFFFFFNSVTLSWLYIAIKVIEEITGTNMNKTLITESTID